MSSYIRIEGWPLDHAQKAYENGYFLEAIQTLHGWLECKLRELFLLQRKPEKSWAKAWDVSNEFSLNNAAKALFLIGELSEEELSKISRFNRIRNNLVHKLFYDPYDEKWQGVPKAEFEELYEVGHNLCHKIEIKSAETLERTNPSNKLINRTD